MAGKPEWWGAGMVICLERGEDLHMAQLMPLTLTVSCFSKIQIGFAFLVPAHPGSPDKGPLNGRVCSNISFLFNNVIKFYTVIVSSLKAFLDTHSLYVIVPGPPKDARPHVRRSAAQRHWQVRKWFSKHHICTVAL